MKKFVNGKGETIIDFQAEMVEAVSNVEFFVYANGKVSTMKNSEYDKNKDMFVKDKPFWGAKVSPLDKEAADYLKANFNTEIYNDKLLFKCTKRKYMPSVFPPMFYGEDGNQFDGVIPKGSIVNIRVCEEEYTRAQKLHKKLTLRGISVIQNNTAKGVADVECRVTAETDHTAMENMELQRQIKLLRSENAVIKKGVDAIVDGLLEHQAELLNEFKSLKEELVSVKEELASIKASNKNTCQNIQPPVECKQEDNKELEGAWDIPSDMFDEDYFDKENDYDIPF